MTNDQLALVLERIKLVFVELMDGVSLHGITFPAARVNSKVFRRKNLYGFSISTYVMKISDLRPFHLLCGIYSQNELDQYYASRQAASSRTPLVTDDESEVYEFEPVNRHLLNSRSLAVRLHGSRSKYPLTVGGKQFGFGDLQ